MNEVEWSTYAHRLIFIMHTQIIHAKDFRKEFMS